MTRTKNHEQRARRNKKNQNKEQRTRIKAINKHTTQKGENNNKNQMPIKNEGQYKNKIHNENGKQRRNTTDT
jgi:hypothetical protein